jgi:hypothetical protein
MDDARSLCRAGFKSMMIEELQTFLDVVAPVLFAELQGEIHPVILTMWGHFRRAAQYFLRYSEGQHTESQVRAAQDDAFQYAKLVQQHLDGKLLTLLLHRFVVHLPDQVLALGPSAWWYELWLEREVRRTVQFTSGHASRNAAQYAANICLRHMGLQQCKVEYPDIDSAITIPDVEHKEDSRDTMDKEGVCLVGPLRPASGRQDGDDVRFCNGLLSTHSLASIFFMLCCMSVLSCW